MRGVLGQFHTDPRSVGDDEEAVFELSGALDDFALGRLVLPARVLQQREVGNAGRQLQAGRGAHGTQRIMRHHLGSVGFRQRGDLLAIRQPARKTHVRPDILHGPAL